MRSPLTATVAFVLSWTYLWVVLVTGCLHHHESVGAQNPTHQCAACAWQAKAISDAPVIHPFQFQAASVEMPERFPVVAWSASISKVTAARGPPSIFA
jgi:hypothetical protein